MNLFADDVLALVSNSESLQGFGSLEEKLSWLLFVDGCFLLFLMYDDEEVGFKLSPLFDQVIRDVVLLENQLPYLLLKLLWKNDNDNELIQTMVKFLRFNIWSIPGMNLPKESEPPIHLLDLQRKIILTKSDLKMKKQSWTSSCQKLNAYRNIEDLTTIGIKLKLSKTRRRLDVDFSEGWFAAELTLPYIIVSDTSIGALLNLTAYEMCPHIKNDFEICSFMVFINSLIVHPEDVKKLRSEGILRNYIGRDEEVVDLFNIICSDLTSDTSIYEEVTEKIYDHRSKKCKIWLAMGYRTYFSNPWAIIGFLAGVFVLVLTFLQTLFTIKPR